MIEQPAPKPIFYGASPTSSVEFNIDEEGKARIFRILRSSVYSKRTLAVIREVCANAWDSHVMSGCPDAPIKVTLPTRMSPDFIVRDYGAGLSHEEMIERYPTYGFSSKRNDPNAIGCLGLGCKAPFAYSDSFTVTTFRSGIKRVYSIYLDGDDRERMDLTFEGPTDEPDGLAVQVPVKGEDAVDFYKDSKILNFMVPTPKTNIPIPVLEDIMVLDHGILTFDTPREWSVLMGFIPYDLEISEIQKDLETAGVWDLAKEQGGYLKVSLGEVSITPSRESVRYDNATKKAIIHKFIALKHEIEALDQTIRADASLSNYERIMWTVYLQSWFGEGVKFAPWETGLVQGDEFHLYRMSTLTDKRGWRNYTQSKWMPNCKIFPEKGSVFGLIFVDDKRSIHTIGRLFPDYVYMAQPKDGVSNRDALAALKLSLESAGWGGLPIVLASAIRPKRKTPVRSTDKKPKVTAYKLYKDNWLEVEGDIPPNSVVVPIHNSQYVGDNTGVRVKTLLGLYDRLRIDPPDVYGIKQKQFTEDKNTSVDAAFDRLMSLGGVRERVVEIVEDFYRERKADLVGSFVRDISSLALPKDHPFRVMIYERYAHRSGNRYDYHYRYDPLIEELSQEVQRMVYDPFEQKYPFMLFRLSDQEYSQKASKEDVGSFLRLIQICDQQKE